MNILITGNHGDIVNPKEGADIRRHNLAIGLSKYNNVIALESNKYKYDNLKPPRDITIDYFEDYYFLGKPLSLFIDFNFSFITKIIKYLIHSNIDIVQVSFPSGILIIKLITKILNKRSLIIYDAHNVERDVAKNIFSEPMPLIIKLIIYLYVKSLEYMAVNLADHIISVSSVDARRFINLYGINDSKVSIIESGINNVCVPDIDDKINSKRCLGIVNPDIINIIFHGTFSYPPNKDAMDLIINYIAPNISEKFNNVEFILAGAKVPQFIKGNIRAVGFIDDLTILLNTADIAIVPIRSGGGTRIKILDYLSRGIPIITTKKGIEGIDVEQNKDAIVADDVNTDFINSLELLINDKEKRNTMSSNALKLANKYLWDNIILKLNELYMDMIYTN